MTRVVLIRPGSTDYDEQNRIQGTLDLPLSARGIEEAGRVAAEIKAAPLPLDRVYAAAGESSTTTAKAIADALDVRFRKLDKLQNVNQGLWQGLCADEVRRKHPRVYRQWMEAPATVCPPSGETMQDALVRVTKVLRSVLRRHRDEQIGLVVPEPLLSVVRCFLTRGSMDRLWESQNGNGRWQVVEVSSDEATPSQ